MIYQKSSQSGFSFVELLVTAALVSLVFGGLFGAVNGMIQLIGTSKAKAGATAMAVERIEYIRSLPYNSIGTISGVPAGTLPQNATSSINGILYHERLVIEYVDDEADGFGGADSNGILADYKKVKIEISWNNKGATSSVNLVTSVMPIGIESVAGGGTIRVNVFDATTAPVINAAVRFYNDSTTSTIDTTRYTNNEGIAYLSGAPAAANYQMTVTKAGYSTDGTIVATTSNPNPTTQPIAVVESAVSTMNFQIDRTSSLDIETLGIPATNSFDDDFADGSKVLQFASTTLNSGAIELELNAGNFVAVGSVSGATTSPAVLDSWETLNFTSSTSASTTLRVSLYYESAGVLNIIPDIDLPGNSTGFTGGPVALDTLDASIYDTLSLRATLETTDSSETPQLHEWSLSYIETQATIPNVDFALNGAKVIGTTVAGLPVYKVSVVSSTDGSGEYSIPVIEWDSYTLDITDSGYQVVEICPYNPFAIAPNTTNSVKAILRSFSGAFLRVLVVDSAGNVVPGASVELDKTAGSYNETKETSVCGQAAFYNGGISSDIDYNVTVTASGFTTTVLNDVVVNSTSTLKVIMN